MDEDDTVSLTVSLGSASPFMTFDSDQSTLRVTDLSSELVLEGSFSVSLTLDDGKDTFTHTIVVNVHEVEESLEDDLQNPSETASNNSTETSEGSQANATYTNLPAAAVELAKAKAQISETVKVYRKSILNRKRVSREDPGKKKEEPEPPVPRIKKILQDGLLEITFS